MTSSTVMHPRRVLCFAAIACAAAGLSLESRSEATLPRISSHPMDQVDGVSIEYGALKTSDGAVLRTLVSRPVDAKGPLPAIYFVQWLSCDTVELVEPDGWTDMLTTLIRDSGYVVARTDKSGVGDSVGPACQDLDYETEVRHHREALAALLRRPEVDPSRVVLFGASMGANQAPLVADGYKLAGLVVWGGGAQTWFERMLNFDRRSLELGGIDPADLSEAVRMRSLFHTEYLLREKTPAQVEADNPQLKGVWSDILGTSENRHYGRPFSFHYQAQRANWPAAWSRIHVPVLVLYGEYDWGESLASHQLIAGIVNRTAPGTAELRVVPGSDHHFSRFPSAQAAFDGTGGVRIGAEVAKGILAWIRDVPGRH